MNWLQNQARFLTNNTYNVYYVIAEISVSQKASDFLVTVD